MIDPNPTRNPVITDRGEIETILRDLDGRPVILEVFALNADRERCFAAWIEGKLTCWKQPVPADVCYRVVEDSTGTVQQAKFALADVHDVLLPLGITLKHGRVHRWDSPVGRITITVQLARRA